MKYYKDINNVVYAYEADGSQDEFIGDKVLMTTEEVNLHKNPPKTLEQQQSEISNAIQSMLDTKARELRYDNILSARSYAGYPNPYQTEAQSLAVWASDCWVKAGQIEAEVLAGTRALPKAEEALAEMPKYE